MSPALNFRASDELAEGVERHADESGVSKSEVLREAVRFYLANHDSVPDHVAHDHKIRGVIDRNKAERRKGKFRGNFKDELKASFSDGETPAEFEASVAGYLEEAEDMGTIPGREQTFSEWVSEMLDYYRVAHETSEFGHDERDHPLEGFDGVERAGEWADRSENIAAEYPDQTGAQQAAARAIEDGAVPERLLERAMNANNDPTSPRTQASVVSEAAARLHGVDPHGVVTYDPDELPPVLPGSDTPELEGDK